MKHFYYPFLAAAIAFTSCKNNDKKEQVTDRGVVPFTQQTTTTNSPQAPVAETHNLFRENNATTAVNPAHGQPNHRCDISVGAPLDSAPNKSSIPVNQMDVQPQ